MLKEWGKLVRKNLSGGWVSKIRSLYDVAQGINDTQEKLVRVKEQLRHTKKVMNN